MRVTLKNLQLKVSIGEIKGDINGDKFDAKDIDVEFGLEDIEAELKLKDVIKYIDSLKKKFIIDKK